MLRQRRGALACCHAMACPCRLPGGRQPPIGSAPHLDKEIMDFSIAAILAQDGITTGAIYALLALAIVLVFSVTRAIFIPQGEFVAFGALTLAAMQSNRFPHSATLLVALGVCC